MTDRKDWDKEWRVLDDNVTPRPSKTCMLLAGAIRQASVSAVETRDAMRVICTSGQSLPIEKPPTDRRFVQIGEPGEFCWPLENLQPFVKITSGDGSTLGQALLSAGVTEGETVEFDSLEEMKAAVHGD